MANKSDAKRTKALLEAMENPEFFTMNSEERSKYIEDVLAKAVKKDDKPAITEEMVAALVEKAPDLINALQKMVNEPTIATATAILPALCEVAVVIKYKNPRAAYVKKSEDEKVRADAEAELRRQFRIDNDVNPRGRIPKELVDLCDAYVEENIEAAIAAAMEEEEVTA